MAECGALNEWLAVAPNAQPICSQVGAMVNLDDFADRPALGLSKNDVIETGRHRCRFVPTPHLPHGWDAGVLFEEKSGVLLCSDLFTKLATSSRSRLARSWGVGMPLSRRTSSIRC